jgi:trehalose-phosphatase
VTVEGVPDFWERVREAPHRLLALDYDGTLAPFRVERMQARPLPGVGDALGAIGRAPGTTLLVVSGRPATEVARLLGDVPCAVSGAHGFERRDPDGRVTAHDPSPPQRAGLADAERIVHDLGFRERGERKVASLAVHTRGLPEVRAREIEAQVAAAWQPLAAGGQLAVRPFSGGVELRARGRDKGTVLGEARRGLPPGTLAVYIGDDDTDEDAFRAVADGGIGIRVGDDRAPTAAAGRLPDCAAVLALLRAWAEGGGA